MPWEQVPEQNRALMIATVEEVCRAEREAREEDRAEYDNLRAHRDRLWKQRDEARERAERAEEALRRIVDHYGCSNVRACRDTLVESDRDRALEAATEALNSEASRANVWRPEPLAKAAVAGFLDSLLEGLPEEAVEAASEVVGNRGDGVFAKTAAAPMLQAALRSLRTNL